MGFDINDTRTMLEAMEQSYAPTTTLVDTFFPHTQNFVTNTVSMEFRKGGRMMAPFIVPGGKGVNMARAGSIVREYKPPMMRPKRTIEVADIAKRGFGETIYSTRTAAERATEMRAKDLQELQEACARREEWMAAQCLLNGEYDIKGFADDGVATVVDTMSFGFEGKTTLSGNDTWDNASAKIYDNIGDTSQKIRRAAGDIPTIAICSSNVVKYLLANEQLYKYLLVPSRENLALLSLQPKLERPDLMRVGFIQALNLEIYSYDGGYTDEESGEYKAYIPDNHMIIGVPGLGRRLYGAVTQVEDDKQYHTYAAARVPKATVNVENDTSSLAVSSRCVLCPDFVDKWATLKVK